MRFNELAHNALVLSDYPILVCIFLLFESPVRFEEKKPDLFHVFFWVFRLPEIHHVCEASNLPSLPFQEAGKVASKWEYTVSRVMAGQAVPEPWCKHGDLWEATCFNDLQCITIAVTPCFTMNFSDNQILAWYINGTEFIDEFSIRHLKLRVS